MPRNPLAEGAEPAGRRKSALKKHSPEKAAAGPVTFSLAEQRCGGKTSDLGVGEVRAVTFDGKRLGLSLTLTRSPAVGGACAVRVEVVVAGGAADAAKIRKGDALVGCGGRALAPPTDSGGFNALMASLGRAPRPLVLAFAACAEGRPPPVRTAALGDLFLTGAGPSLGFMPTVDGLRVDALAEDAEERGVTPGDILVALNGDFRGSRASRAEVGVAARALAKRAAVGASGDEGTRASSLAAYWDLSSKAGRVSATFVDEALVEDLRRKTAFCHAGANGLDPPSRAPPLLPGTPLDESDVSRAGSFAAAREEGDVEGGGGVSMPSRTRGGGGGYPRATELAVATFKRLLVAGFPVIKHARNGKRREIALRPTGDFDGVRWATRKRKGEFVAFADVVGARAAVDGRVTASDLAPVLRQNLRPHELRSSLTVDLADTRGALNATARGRRKGDLNVPSP